MQCGKDNAMSLTYLFRAHFTDGTTYQQKPDDKARLNHPRKGEGSAFTDLLYLTERKRNPKTVAAFALCDPQGQGIAAVHLETGHFELCGNGFYAGEDGLGALPPGAERRLVYFRVVTQERTQSFVDGEPLGASTDVTRIRYFLGWQATINGRNVQHVIGLDG
jgi:hypothetical protein